MKKSLLLFGSLLLSLCLFSQTGWFQVNSGLPAGQGVGQISISLLNENALWALPISVNGSIVDGFTKSTDGGLTWAAGTFNAGTGLSIGIGSQGKYIGLIDEVGLWSKPLTDSEVQMLYNNGNGLTYPF